jgi:hypothetical protein
MWQLHDESKASVFWLLEESGYDSSSASIDRAIANIHPNKLSLNTLRFFLWVDNDNITISNR